MKIKYTVSVVSRKTETSEERFERITTVKMNVKDSILINPEYDIVDLFKEVNVDNHELPESMIVLGRL